MHTEWIGGCLPSPFYVTDRETPYRPFLAIWAEFPSDVILALEMVPPEDTDGALGRALRSALEAPLVGKPRFPPRIRVASDELAAEARAVVGPKIKITVAPTPELGEIVELMRRTMPGRPDEDDHSYLENGRVPADAVAALFVAADALFKAAPWKHADDDQVVHVDIPALGVHGACLSILGALGEVHGFALFPSLAAYERFIDAAPDNPTPGQRIDHGTPWLSLYYVAATELPARMRREAASSGWRVNSPDAYPIVSHCDSDGLPRPLLEHDVRVATACAGALAKMAKRHRRLFALDAPEPVCEVYTDKDGPAVRMTIPYEAIVLFDVDVAAQLKGARESSPPPLPPEIADEIMRSFKERHYAEWPDIPLPALEGKTPREAARSARGRKKLAALIGDMEKNELRQPAETRYDFTKLRRVLRVER